MLPARAASSAGPVVERPRLRGSGGLPAGKLVNCTGTVDITLNGGRARAAKKTSPRLLGRSSFSLAPGKRANLKIAFSKMGRKLLGSKRRHSITVTLRPKGGPAVSIRPTVTLPKRR